MKGLHDAPKKNSSLIFFDPVTSQIPDENLKKLLQKGTAPKNLIKMIRRQTID